MALIYKTWFSSSESSSLTPLAWTKAKFQIHAELSLWENLHVYVNELELPLSLSKHAGGTKLMSEWPALEPGFYDVKLCLEDQCLHQQEVFVATQHLNANDWISLLQDLRYQWPKDSLSLKSSLQVPVRPLLELSSIEEEEVLCLVSILEGSQQHLGVLAALQALDKNALKRPMLQESIEPLCRVKSIDTRLLFRNVTALKPEHRVQQFSVKNDLDIPENRWVVFIVNWLLQHLSELKAYLQARGNFYWHQKLSRLHNHLIFLWLKNPLRRLTPLLELPRQTELFVHNKEYSCFFHVWHLIDAGHVPYLAGQRKFSYQKFALLYQNWCLVQLARLLLQWAEKHQWLVLKQNSLLRRGQPLIVLVNSLSQSVLSLVPERLYGSKGLPYSGTRPQRPDISLVYEKNGFTELVVFECKFRADQHHPFKEDLDRLHAYRDAIRHADGSAAVKHAVLLYPGEKISYPALLDVWQAHPGKLLEWELSELLHKMFSIDLPL